MMNRRWLRHAALAAIILCCVVGISLPAQASVTTELAISLPAQSTELTRIAISPDGGTLYATDNQNNRLLRFDTKKRTWMAPISVRSSPIGLAVTPSGSHVVVAGNGGIDVVNTSTRTVRHLAGSDNYEGVAIAPQGRFVYAGSFGVVVTKFDLLTGTSTDIDVSGGNSSQPQSVAISPDGSKVYAADTAQNLVEVISTTTDTVIARIPVGTIPNSITVSRDGSRAYVTNFSSSTVSVISTATDSVEATVVAGDHPSGIDISPDGTQYVVSSTYAQQLIFYSTETNTQVSLFTISAGSGTSQPRSLVFSPNGARVYVSLPSATALGIFTVSPQLGQDAPVSLANTGADHLLVLSWGFTLFLLGAMTLLALRRRAR